jgi:uncharacterized membrane protein YcaP (DUF421 family)
MRIMGKRQLGQLQLSELVSAIFISELATYPVTNSDIPLTFGILPVITLLAAEVILSFCSIKIPIMKKVFDDKPAFLIKRGKLMQEELLKNRITLDELISQLRQNNCPDISKAFYAILEPNGQVSVMVKADEIPPTRKDMSLSVPEDGICHAIIDDGKINDIALSDALKNIRWLEKTMVANGIKSPEELFLLAVSDGGTLYFVRKESS